MDDQNLPRRVVQWGWKQTLTRGGTQYGVCENEQRAREAVEYRGPWGDMALVKREVSYEPWEVVE